jgi:endonuclease-3
LADEKAVNILQTLKQTLTMPEWSVKLQTPFETLIATIISQNTTDTNTRRAFESLSKRFEITPQDLAKAESKELEDCLHDAGLHKSKSKTIHEVSKIISENFGGSLAPILALSLDEARQTLMEMPGVGPKTADVVLLFSANLATVPVDAHVNRVSKRLGLSPELGDYEAVRLKLMSLFESKDYLALHLLLIEQGRKYCKARKPKCLECQLNSFCPSKSFRCLS